MTHTTRESLTISTTRTLQGWECATMLRGYRRHVHYIGYTKRQALAAFRVWCRTLTAQEGE